MRGEFREGLSGFALARYGLIRPAQNLTYFFAHSTEVDVGADVAVSV